MAKARQVYRCSACGNLVEVIEGGKGFLVCDGQAMQLILENTVDAAQEKHVPVVEKTENGIRVRVGADLHPVLPDHYIGWIEVLVDGVAQRKFLEPGDPPVAEFHVSGGDVEVRSHCNLHGLWK